jgi:hypothetical protein
MFGFVSRLGGVSRRRASLAEPCRCVDDAKLERALMEEELAERARDREYWRPLRAELERLRHQRA